jgi:chorismate mutase
MLFLKLTMNDRKAHERIVELRETIDILDSELIEVLGKRFAVTRQVGELKAEFDLPASSPDREKDQMVRFQDLAAQAQLNPAFVTDLMRLVIDEVVRNHKSIAHKNK